MLTHFVNWSLPSFQIGARRSISWKFQGWGIDPLRVTFMPLSPLLEAVVNKCLWISRIASPSTYDSESVLLFSKQVSSMKRHLHRLSCGSWDPGTPEGSVMGWILSFRGLG
jgi:hypothetical protein